VLTPDHIRELTNELAPTLIEIRRDLHQHPELAFEEKRTAGIVERWLSDLGIEHRRVAKTGVLGMLRGNAPGNTVLLRADMDALPVHEQSQVPYRSKTPGLMHACGHDGHVAILLGVAAILARIRQELAGNVKFAFQPAEESRGGALPMINEGVLENPSVDAVFGLHLGSFIPVGIVGLLPRVGMSSSDSATITVHGKGGHGATPADSVDATIIAAHIAVALQTIISREIPPQEFGVITVGSLHSGTVRNAISGQAELQLTIRSFNSELRRFLEQRVHDVARGVATTFRAAVDIDYKHGYPVLISDREETERVRRAAQKVLGMDQVMDIDVATGSEDFAYFLHERPGCFFWLGAGNAAKGIDKPHHHPEFDIDEDAIPAGVQVMVQLALDYLS